MERPNKPIAIVDLDDTIGDFCNILVHSLNYHFHRNYVKEDFDDFFGICDMYGISYDEFCGTIIKDDLFMACAPLPGTREALTRLVRDHYVVIETSRGYDPDAVEKTNKWMSFHSLPAHEILVPKEGQSKTAAFKELFDVAPVVTFDDAKHNNADFREAFPESLQFQPMQPWNRKTLIQGLDNIPNLHRVRSFREGVSCYYADYVEGR